MNIYEKLANARADFKAAGIKQSGENKFAGYTYFDLADILPYTTKLEKEYKMLSVVSYGIDVATLTIYNAENPEESITFSSPMSTAELKGCHAVQNLGAVETYVRRYLYLVAYEIVETEALDRTQGDPEKAPEKRQSQQSTDQGATVEMTEAEALCYSMKRGKHAGKPFSDVPQDYLKWAAENLEGKGRTAAKLVLQYIEKTKRPEKPTLQEVYDDNDIPF